MNRAQVVANTGIGTYWQVIHPDVSVKWQMGGGDDKSIGFFILAGLVMYRDVNFAAIRGIPLSTMTAHREGFPELHQDDAPTHRQIEQAWNSEAGLRARVERRTSAHGKFAHRREGESVDHFYMRVAEAYSAAKVLTGTPTLDIASRASVPRTTAARWVREARARGFLAATIRGKSMA